MSVRSSEYLNIPEGARFAAIDIGTNTALLLVVEVRAGQLVPLIQEQRFPRLGQNLAQTGFLQRENMDRALGFLKEYVQICRLYGVEWVRAVGTAALREARNGADFLEMVRRELALEIEVISPEQEARFAFLGSLSNKNLTGFGLVCDIGGGSTELIWGEPHLFQGFVSLPTGSVKLTERFGLHRAVPAAGLRQASEWVRGELAIRLSRKPDWLVGTAGTFTTLAAIDLELNAYDADRIDGHVLHRSAVEKMVKRLASLNAAERLAIPGIPPGREEVILAGAILAHEVMKYLGFDTCTVSDRGIRWGAILDRLHGESKTLGTS